MKLPVISEFNYFVSTCFTYAHFRIDSIVARRDGWVRALGGARASVRGPTTGFVDVVQV